MTSVTKRAISLLVVDDDSKFAQSISEHDSIAREGWSARIARDSKEALDLLSKSRSDIVIAKLNLPGDSGDILLSHAKREHPNALRFLLIDPSDKSSVQKGTGLAHMYLKTPIDPGELIKSVSIVLHTQLRIRRKEVVDIIRDTKELHINTQPMQELLKTTDNPNCSLEDLMPVISKHPTAVATTLQVANTAFIGAGGHVDTIEQAIQMLGMDYVRNLAITELAKKQLELSPGMQEIANGVLKHCVETSRCGSHMRQFGVSAKQAQTLSSITLLHDLGKLVLLANKGEDYADLMGRSIENNRPLWHLEQAIYQCDHASIGAFLFAVWGLPENIVRATAWHHEPVEFATNEFCYVNLLHFANCAAHIKHEVPFYYGDELIPEVAEKVGLPLDYVKLLE
jgi:HD-like signal output (HDOD) protein/CheY-like chemotaxis protein